MSKLQEKPSALKRFINVFYVCGSFLSFCIRIANPDPDPGTPLKPVLIRIRIHSTAYNHTLVRQYEKRVNLILFASGFGEGSLHV